MLFCFTWLQLIDLSIDCEFNNTSSNVDSAADFVLHYTLHRYENAVKQCIGAFMQFLSFKHVALLTCRKRKSCMQWESQDRRVTCSADLRRFGTDMFSLVYFQGSTGFAISKSGRSWILLDFNGKSSRSRIFHRSYNLA